jgi:hypothetical protein
VLGSICYVTGGCWLRLEHSAGSRRQAGGRGPGRSSLRDTGCSHRSGRGLPALGAPRAHARAPERPRWCPRSPPRRRWPSRFPRPDSNIILSAVSRENPCQSRGIRGPLLDDCAERPNRFRRDIRAGADPPTMLRKHVLQGSSYLLDEDAHFSPRDTANADRAAGQYACLRIYGSGNPNAATEPRMRVPTSPNSRQGTSDTFRSCNLSHFTTISRSSR